jgi:hypothetical protein
MSAACTRRSFTESLALMALAPTFGIRPDAMVTPYAPSVADVAESAAAAGAMPGALAKALARVVRAQYSARLSPSDMTAITEQIQSSLDRAAKIRKIDLANGDEPDFVYSALPRPAESH